MGFVKADSLNPVLGPSAARVFVDPILKQPVRWEAKDVFNPAVVVKDNQVYLLYRAENQVGTVGKASRIGLAVSADGLHFTRQPQPVLYPAPDAQQQYEWPGGIEDPRVVQGPDRRYYLTYTAYDGTLARLHVAASADLVHWIKSGSAFAQAYGGKYLNKWSKSGAVVARYEADGRIVAAKINGRYWMYWDDAQIWAATSDDLIHWTPVKMATGQQPPVPLRAQALTVPDLQVVLPTRAGKFDSDPVEPGPPAMLTDQGIRLIYNSRNDPAFGDKTLPLGTYAAAQALFDKARPHPAAPAPRHLLHSPRAPLRTHGSGQPGGFCGRAGAVQGPVAALLRHRRLKNRGGYPAGGVAGASSAIAAGFAVQTPLCCISRSFFARCWVPC